MCMCLSDTVWCFHVLHGLFEARYAEDPMLQLKTKCTCPWDECNTRNCRESPAGLIIFSNGLKRSCLDLISLWKGLLDYISVHASVVLLSYVLRLHNCSLTSMEIWAFAIWQWVQTTTVELEGIKICISPYTSGKFWHDMLASCFHS